MSPAHLIAEKLGLIPSLGLFLFFSFILNEACFPFVASTLIIRFDTHRHDTSSIVPAQCHMIDQQILYRLCRVCLASLLQTFN